MAISARLELVGQPDTFGAGVSRFELRSSAHVSRDVRFCVI